MKNPAVLGASVTPIAYFTLSLSAPVTISSSPAFSLSFPAGTLNGYAYVALYDPTQGTSGWNAIVGPIAASGTTLSLTSLSFSPPYTIAANQTYVFAIVETGAPLPTPTPVAPGSTALIPGPNATLPPVESAVGSPNSLWSPYDVATALQFPVQSGYDGSGQTVAIVVDAWPSPTDVSYYLNAFKITQTGTLRLLDGPDGPHGTGAGSIGEATLDSETVAGLAPGANVIVYGTASLDTQSFDDTVNAIVANNAASVISYSAGGCEYSGAAAASSIFANAAGKGIAVVASAGDQGNECYTGGTPAYQAGAGYPASDPNVISVGGTETDNQELNDTLSSNTVWNDLFFGGSGTQGAGGGGVSSVFTLPPYQVGLAGVQSTSQRNVPDISMPAEDSANYQAPHWYADFGTSWSAPQYAALIAEIYEYCRTSIANPVTIPYAVFSHNASAFIDVLNGNNQYANSTPYYTAGTGFDNASGLGVPLGVQIASSLCPNRTPASAAIARAQQVRTLQSHAPAQPYSVDVTPRLTGLVDRGRRAQDEQTRIQIVLRNTATAASDESAVIDALRGASLRITQTFGNHLVVDAQAPSATVERFFDTRIENVVQEHYGTRYLPAARVLIPASLAPYVNGVVLDNVVTMRRDLRRMPVTRR